MTQIPKVTHQIWFQGWNNLPEKYRGYTNSLSIFNPNWEHMKWDEASLRAECEKFSPEALAKFDGFENMIQKVDFGRYVVLYNYGGISVDCDVECLKPLEKIPCLDRYEILISRNAANETEDFLMTRGWSTGIVMLNNATICSTKEHPIMEQFIEFLIENDSSHEEKTMDTQFKTGPLITSMFFNAYLDDPRIHILDPEIVEPWGYVNKRTVLNHVYSSSWVNPIFQWIPKFYTFIRMNVVIILFILFIAFIFYFIRKLLFGTKI